nr:F0F1 ATP synthase subunit A [Devriesea agamarum]
MKEFFPEAIFGQGTFFEFNRIQLVRLVVVVVVCVTLCLIASRAKLVPGKAQSALELVMDFVDRNIVVGVLGIREGKRFAPMLTTIFIVVLAMNLSGAVPGLNIAGTSVVGMPLALALWTFVTYVYFGVRKHGLAGYLKHETMPPGLPKPIYLLLVPIEFLQVVLIRWGSLTIRLLANMVAGHMMLAVFVSMSQALLLGAWWMKAMSPLSFGLSLGIYGFEIFVAILQAFIFAMLSAVYIQMATSDEH